MIFLSRESLESNLDSWKGGYINVNHADGGEITGFKIEDAKFENDLLYHKVNPKVAEFIRNPASSGRSIEINILERVGETIMSFVGKGLAVLFPPQKPACTTDMGCFSGDGNVPEQSAIKEIFTKLSDKLKSHSFVDNTIETSGNDPNLETSMTEDIEKLTSARVEAEHGRDEALKVVETLKFSLVEKDSVIIEKDKILADKDALLKEQTERLKFYADAEAAAAAKLKEDQFEILKSSIPVGKFHKPEDEAALKAEFINDPAAFAVKMMSWKREDPKGESGAEFTSGTGGEQSMGEWDPVKKEWI